MFGGPEVPTTVQNHDSESNKYLREVLSTTAYLKYDSLSA
jgi:hypothetical protein